MYFSEAKIKRRRRETRCKRLFSSSSAMGMQLEVTSIYSETQQAIETRVVNTE